MKEADWDAPDEGVIDFEDMIPEKELQKKVVSVKKPTLPPKKEESEPGMTPKQEKMISDAAKAAKQLSQALQALDFQLEKFNKFEQKVSSFKIKNTIAIGSVALLLGGYIGSSVQSELYTYYVQQEVKHKLSLAVADLELIKKAREQGVEFATEDGRIVIYTAAQNKAAAVWKDTNHQGLQLTLQNTKKGEKK